VPVDRGSLIWGGCMKRLLLAAVGALTAAVFVAGGAGAAGQSGSACIAHRPAYIEDVFESSYTAGCTGHDEPELDPVSSAPGSARNITWRVALPADGTFPVSSVGPTFWFGGTVKDTNPNKIGGEGFLELQFSPDSSAKKRSSNGGFSVTQQANVYTACSPVWTIAQQGGQIIEPAAFNGMLMDAAGKGPLIMHALDVVDVHIRAPSPTSAYQEQVT